MSFSPLLHPRLLLTKLGLRYCRHWPSPMCRRFVRNRFRKWCVAEDLVVYSRFGFRMSVSPRDYTSYGIYFFGEYDPLMSEVVRHYVREGQTVWDVGAERGWFSLLMGTMVGTTGRVDSFEAYPPNALKLRTNVELNNMATVHVNQVAVSDHPGKLSFQPPNTTAAGESDSQPYTSGDGHLTDTPGEGGIVVEAITLDEYAERTAVRNLSFIKMDIEGAELKALRGARTVLTRFRPILAIEYSRLNTNRAGTSIEELDHLLGSYAYERFTFEDRFQKLDLSRWQNDPQAIFNVYCFPSSTKAI